MSDDNELVALAKAGDKKARNELSERYMLLAQEKAKGYLSSGLEFDDLVQEAMFGFLSALGTYEEDKPASFRTYVNTCMENRILNAIKYTKMKKRIPLNGYVSLEDSDAESGSTASNPEMMYILKANLLNLLERAENELSDYENEVFKLHFSDHSYEEIAEITNTSVKSVDNAMQRARKKLR